MEKELSVSFNIQLSPEILNELKEEQNKLLVKFSERRFYDSSPHLAIATKFMGESLVLQFINALKNKFSNEEIWELEFSDFGPSITNDYIFLHLNPESKQKLTQLHEHAFEATKCIGLEESSGGRFRHFDYDPHISLIKVGSENIDEALALVKKDMSGMKMPVTQYVVTRQTDNENGFADFPIVCEINLK